MPAARSSSRRRGRVVLVLLALVVIAAVAGYLVATRGSATAVADSSSAATGSSAGSSSAGSSAAGSSPADPTEEPVGTPGSTATRSPEGSAASSSSSPSSSASGGQQRQVSVTQTYADWDAGSTAIVVDAQVTGVIESGGTCTLTLTREGRSARATAPATPDAATTYCGEMAVPGDELISGAWTGAVSYSSPRAEGSSPSFSVVVP